MTPLVVSDSGVTDNLPAINQAIRDAYDAGGGQVVIPAATGFYGCRGPVRMLPRVELVLQGPGAVLKNTTTSTDYHANNGIQFGTYGGWETMTAVYSEAAYPLADVPAGSSTVTLTSGGDFEVGDVVALRSAEVLFGTRPAYSMVNEVTAVTGATLTLRHQIPDPYITSNGQPPLLYRVNTDPDDTTPDAPVGIDGKRAYLCVGAAITGGGQIHCSDWAQAQENKGQAVHFSAYDCRVDYFGKGGSVGSGNPMAFVTGHIRGMYRKAGCEIAYLSNNTELQVDVQRFGPVTVGEKNKFALSFNSEGVTDCTVTLGSVSHYGTADNGTIINNGLRCTVTRGSGVIVGGTSIATCIAGQYSRGALFDGLVVSAPTSNAFYASPGCRDGKFQSCRVENAPTSPLGEAFKIANGADARVLFCSSGNRTAPTAADVLVDKNPVPNQHLGNRLG